MERLTRLLPSSLAVTSLAIACAVSAFAQPAGGKTSEPTTKPASKTNTKTTTTTTRSKPTTTAPPKTTNRSVSNAPASIDGKWWTSGNDFGASEVIFTQNGASVSGVIHYADGRTGTVSGTIAGKRLQFTFTSSNGDGGSGWLELSWNNFLGGPWHNQRVRDGSWTLMRLEGKWCFGGSRTRIRTVTHNARGAISMVDEYGEPEGGYLEGPYLFLESDGMTIKGEMDFRANRVNWSSGFFWTWCGRN